MDLPVQTYSGVADLKCLSTVMSVASIGVAVTTALAHSQPPGLMPGGVRLLPQSVPHTAGPIQALWE